MPDRQAPRACHQAAQPAVLIESAHPGLIDIIKPLPATRGKDVWWHDGLGRWQHSACCECHGRHMVEYCFGQSLPPELVRALEPMPGGGKYRLAKLLSSERLF